MKVNNLKIETERLRFRPLSLEDAEILFDYRSDPAVSRFQNWEPSNIDEVIDFINKNMMVELNTPDSWLQLAIVAQDSNLLVGDFALHFLEEENPQCEIGFTVSPQFQGQGFGTEAVTRMLEFLFSELNKHRVFASVDPENGASMRVLEKAGLNKEAHFKKSLLFKERWVDDVIFAILKDH